MTTQPTEQTGNPAPPPAPTIHVAERASGPSGVVWYGSVVSFDEAVGIRQAGQDVVVRGNDVDANRTLAAAVEAAVGPRTGPQRPHRRAGPHALPFPSSVARARRALLLRDRQPDQEGEETAMKYFTPELIARLNSTDETEVSAAEVEWDRRQEAYEENLRRLEPTLPTHVREFNELLLHDARVYSLARQGDQLILVLRKDIPPRDLVIVTYDLAGEPSIDKEALPREGRSAVMDFDYDEFGVCEEGGQPIYTQEILFSNGWEVRLRFRDVRFVLADPLFASQSVAALPQSA